jgi:hypothetical protein
MDLNRATLETAENYLKWGGNMDDINEIDLIEVDQEFANNWKLYWGKEFPRNFQEYIDNYLTESVKIQVKALGEAKAAVAANIKYIKMGQDFEKILNRIKSDPNVEKQWNNFLMLWRMSDPGASEKNG